MDTIFYIICGVLAIIVGAVVNLFKYKKKNNTDIPIFITKNADGSEEKTYLNRK